MIKTVADAKPRANLVTALTFKHLQQHPNLPKDVFPSLSLFMIEIFDEFLEIKGIISFVIRIKLSICIHNDFEFVLTVLSRENRGGNQLVTILATDKKGLFNHLLFLILGW